MDILLSFFSPVILWLQHILKREANIYFLEMSDLTDIDNQGHDFMSILEKGDVGRMEDGNPPSRAELLPGLAAFQFVIVVAVLDRVSLCVTALAILELALRPDLALNSHSSTCLCLSSAGMKAFSVKQMKAVSSKQELKDNFQNAFIIMTFAKQIVSNIAKYFNSSGSRIANFL
ncbi:hypothetical protein STEG23_028792 [Scotinomys teguina]